MDVCGSCNLVVRLLSGHDVDRRSGEEAELIGERIGQEGSCSRSFRHRDRKHGSER